MKAESLYIQKLTYDENTGNEIIGLFPSEANPAVVSSYTYDAKRMGGAPTLTATIYSSEPLQWKKEEFVEYNGDRFFASYTPNSTKDNSSRMWKNEITFTSRRELLDNTLFFDVVVDDVDTQNKDRYRSNQTKFTFGGTIYEFVARINSSMAYCGLYRPTDEYKGYYVVVDEGYGTDEVKEISFEDQYLTDVLQLINTTFELDYYWDGNVCHVGKVQHDLTDTPIKYGCSDALISVSKENANYKIVDMITGYGSSDNLPYYYPNDDEFGEAVFNTENFSKSLVSSISLGDVLKWNSDVYNNTLILCKNSKDSYTANVFGTSSYLITNFVGKDYKGKGEESKNVIPTCSMGEKYTEHDFASVSRLIGSTTIWTLFEFNSSAKEDTVKMDGLSFVAKESDSSLKFGLEFSYEYAYYVGENTNIDTAYKSIQSVRRGGSMSGEVGGSFGNGDSNVSISKRWAFGDNIDGLSNYTKSSKKEHTFERNSTSTIVIACKITATNIEKASGTRRMNTVSTSISGSIELTHKPRSVYYFETSDGHTQPYDESGIKINGIGDIPHKDLTFSFDGTYWNATEGGENNAAKITITDRVWIAPSSVLMPSIYRNTKGAERFYYALNNTHKLPIGSGYYEFVNLYKKGNPHQGTVNFDDIKPTINGIVNAEGQLFGEIADVAFDKEDSDVKDSDGNYIHSYFYIKLHKFNGDFGFDLFNHVLSKEPAKINLIKSNGCPACSFVIHNQPSADNSKCYNCVSVDENGNLKQVRTDKNDYIFDNASDAYEDNLNQDSTHKELWIAVQKNTSTLGIIMPNASAGFKPQNGDLFVITGIKPPKVLVTAAEKRLDDALIRHMSENNTDQFNYSVKFSRIFLQENPDFASKLNENAKLSIQIQGDSDSDGNLISHEVFVSNYSVKVDNDELAEVEVELVNSLEVTKSDTKQIIDAVKGETVKSLSSMVGGSNTNSFNASITDKMYLSKLKDDTSNGKITFIKGLIAKGLADLMMGARFGNNAKITELGEAFFSAIKSLDYDNAAEQGFSVEKENNGKYHAFFTNLTIWGKAIFHELEVRKRSYSGGNIYLSGAGSKLIKVVPVKKMVSADGVTSWVEKTEEDTEYFGWKCYLLADNGTTATMNYWQEGDQARCQTMGEIAAGGAYSDVSNKSYWRTIPNGGVSTQNEKIYGKKTETYIDEDGNEQTREVQVELYDGQAFAWIVIGKHCGDIDGYDDEFSVGYDGSNPAPLETRDIPSAGDTIVLDGNRHRNEQGEYDKTDRQNVIILETTGEYAPRIACYANITEYKHTFTKRVNNIDKEVSLSVFETSPKGGTKINSSRFEWISDDGSTINIINYRGDWDGNNTYHKNDQVNHNNAVWVCVANSGVDVTAEPSDGSSYWKKVLSGGKGDKGDDAVSYSVSLMKELRTIAGHSNQSAVAVSFRKQEGSKSTVSGNIATFGDSASVKCYIDGERSDNMTDWINSGNDYFGYLNYENAWTGKSVITVVMYIGDNIVASANFSLGQSGEGVVMAYKNATSRPEPPVTEDLSLLTDGWSRTPQKGGSYEKVSNVSYGNYSVGATESEYSTSEWSEVSDGGETWRKSPAGLSNNGWALMKVSFTTNVDNADVRVVIKAYSETNFDFIHVHDIDTEITGSSSLRGVAYISGNGIETSYSYHVTTAGQHFFYVSYCKDSSQNANGDYGLFRIDLSENLVSMPSKVWMSQAVLKEGKAVLPWSTPVQITGDDAYRVVVSPSALIFDTDDNGRVDKSSLSGKTATIRVYQGDKDVSNQFSKYDRFPSNLYNCNGSLKDLNKYPLEIQVTEIETQVVTETAESEIEISKTNGFLEFFLTNGSANVTAHVDVQVNVAKFTGQMVNTNKRFSKTLQEVSTKVDDKVGSSDLTQFKSEITQTAREISLSVSEKSIERRNLLVGSAFLREDNHYTLSRDTRIEMNSGYKGTNCVKVIDDTDGTSHYIGVYWDGSQGGRSVKIEKGKKYTISCYYKTNDSNAKFSLEAIYTDKETNAKRLGRPRFLSPSSFNPKYNQWQLFTTVIDTTDAESDYIAFNFWEYCDVNAGRINAYICRPMVEEGDIYNGWTLSKDDYDIIGANLIDNSRTLDAGGNVFEAKGQKSLVGDAYELTYIGSDDYNTFYRIKGSTFKLNTDYTISFEVRGDAKYMGVYAYYPITNTKFTLYAEPQNGAMTEVTDGGKVNNYVTLIQVEELSKQQRVWSHFRFKDRLPEQIYFQFPKNADQIGVTSWSVTITRPKIEVGAVVTEYTERKSDLVDKASLKAAGIEITSDMVELYGNQVKVSGAKGGTPVAMFENGMLNSNLINAAKIIAERLETTGNNCQSVSIENGLMRVYGTNGRCNIEFGVNSNGEAILSYYDKDGKWLYDLGPNKLDGGQLKESTLDGEKYVSALSLFGTNDFFTIETYINVDVKQVRWNYSQRLFGNNSFVNDDQEIANNNAAHMGYKPFERVSASDVTTLYRYTAPRQSGTIIKDETYGLTTAALAKQADGKYFTDNRNLAINGQLANLAPAGYYFRQSEQVMMAPYPMPSAEIQQARFPAYSIRCLNITIDSTGTVMGGFNAMMSSLMRTIKNQI